MIGDYTSGQKPFMTSNQRESFVELIEHLHKRKGYRVETFHSAVSIMDRFLWQAHKQRLVKEVPSLPHLATICMLMAAKLQQPVSPSFNKMIEQLPDKHRHQVKKQELIDLEFFIVSTLQFDVQWAGPLISLQRYLHVLGMSQEPKLLQVCTELCRFAIYKAEI